MEKILIFFEVNQPCPSEIPDCDNLRLQYVTELNDLKRRGGCGTCAERQLRQNYITRLQQLFK